MSKRDRRIIVTGSRIHDARDVIYSTLDSYLADLMSVLLVGRLGLEVDTMASEWSMGRALPWVAFRVEEELHGEAAEKHCIDEMVRYSTDLLLFWDGVSTDFDYLLERAKKRKLKVKVFVCEPAEETDDFEELVSRLEKHWTSEVEDGQSRESD